MVLHMVTSNDVHFVENHMNISVPIESVSPTVTTSFIFMFVNVLCSECWSTIIQSLVQCYILKDVKSTLCFASHIRHATKVHFYVRNLALYYFSYTDCTAWLC